MPAAIVGLVLYVTLLVVVLLSLRFSWKRIGGPTQGDLFERYCGTTRGHRQSCGTENRQRGADQQGKYDPHQAEMAGVGGY